jgi:membrane-associated phospholipid phosphatase
MTAQQYRRWSAPFRGEKRQKALKSVNRALTLCGYLVYPLLLVLLAVLDRPNLLRAILVPGISFVGVSLLRRALNAPRPYEALDIDALIHKDTHGQSMPSRHVFSIFIIAMSWLWFAPPVGIVLLAVGVVLSAIRVIGGVHFPRDVLVGALIAIACGVVGYWVI